MRAAIRLAERRGKLTGDLSRVQEFALTMWLWQEDHDQSEVAMEARMDQVKMALIASQTQTMENMFPEYVPGDDDLPRDIQSDIDPKDARRIEELLESGGVLRFDDLNEKR